MRARSGETWPIVMAVTAAAAAISAAVFTLSVIDGNMILAAISVASMILFTACAATARTIRSRTSEMESTGEEVKCLKLKKAGIEGRSEEIVPKGKMPND